MQLAPPWFFFGESEFISRGLYNRIQRLSRSYYALCLGVLHLRIKASDMALSSKKRLLCGGRM